MKEGIKGVVYQSKQERENGGIDNSINEQEYPNEEFWEDISAFMNLPSPADTTLSTMDPLCFTEHTTCYVETLGLPRGFQFSPSEPLMVEYYLLNKVKGIPDHSNGIVIESDDVYGNFKEVINFIQVIRRMNCLYFYTKLKKKNKNGIQIDITNYYGTWKERQKESIIDSDIIHIGYKRSFSFVPDTGVHNIGRWTILECGLDGKYADITNRHNYVICRITKHEGMKDPVNQSEQQRENGGMDNTNPSLLVSEPPLLVSEPLQLEENVQPVGHFNNIGLITVAHNFAKDAEEDYFSDPELEALLSPFNPPRQL